MPQALDQTSVMQLFSYLTNIHCASTRCQGYGLDPRPCVTHAQHHALPGTGPNTSRCGHGHVTRVEKKEEAGFQLVVKQRIKTEKEAREKEERCGRAGKAQPCFLWKREFVRFRTGGSRAEGWQVGASKKSVGRETKETGDEPIEREKGRRKSSR